MSSHWHAASRGATLAELVMTIVIIGILAVMAAPRFVSWKGFASRGFHDEALAVVRFAQKTAIAWRRPILVCVSAGEIVAVSNGDCAAPVALTHPATGASLRATAPDGVTLSPVGSFSFDGLGRPSAPASLTVTSTIRDDPARQIVVASETGYVHR